MVRELNINAGCSFTPEGRPVTVTMTVTYQLPTEEEMESMRVLADKCLENEKESK